MGFFSSPLLTREEWLKHGENIYKQWNFPHAVGALDGKHIVMPIVVATTVTTKAHSVLYNLQ